ncbi:MAG: UvrD-helicase domain-containing protein [Sterolibacteriaceae bacterium]|nr:UvrD-helicase domain-containing protein [Candidatus Methylophosphatis haderslevensis]
MSAGPAHSVAAAQFDTRAALDPQASVVVEACAGSGKTWLLVSRIIRLLLDGVAPGRILAITFTRKAAREIEARLADWLRELATGSDAVVAAFIADRGLAPEAARECLPRARGLLQAVLDAQPAMTITTFHGWFARIVGAAPLTSGLAGMTLLESARQTVDEAWQQFARRCARTPDSPAAQSLRWLLGEIGIANTRALLGRFLARRVEWHALCEGRDFAAVIEDLRALHAARDPAESRAAFLAGWCADLETFARLLVANQIPTDMQPGSALQTALAGAADDALFDSACAALLTQKGDPRTRKTNKAMEGRLGVDGARCLVDLQVQLAQAAIETRLEIAEARAFEINRHGLTAGAALLELLERHKHDRRLMDFADLEWHADRLLRDAAQAGFIQARLDARYRHILLDEFQDTNPLQWRVLRAWLDAYDPTQDKPRVFMVGDPKQSIYRFRRAEPRIFTAATELLAREFGAARLPNDATFRNAPAIVDVVNEVFSQEPLFAFRRQTARHGGMPGRVEVLPPVTAASSDPETSHGLRDPLTAALDAAEDRRHAGEAALLAARIVEMVGQWEVMDQGRPRAARYDDVLVLCRRRTRLAEYERALRDAGIPYVTSSRGGLLRTLEAQDLCALLRFLASPADDLALAHALRAPLLALGDDDLLHIARTGDGASSWWLRLCQAAQGLAGGAGGPGAAIVRAQRLLARWLDLAGRLPVHDLLDRIYFEGEIAARTRAVVPPAAWPSVAANLEAFIGASLQLDAARYPSLPRFIDEMARLEESADEAPDEGVIGADGGDAALGRVRIMTIHGAKGLEAPVVWLIDAHSTQTPADAYRVLLDWPPQDDRPVHFSFAGRKDETGGRRGALLAAEAEAAAREDLNLLYVALTRAAQYLFVSGVAEARPGQKVSAWQRVADAVGRLVPGSLVYGDPPRSIAAPRQTIVPAVAPGPDAAVAVGMRRPAASLGQRYGLRLHALLERAGTAPAPRPAGPAPPAAEDEAIERQVQAILAAAELQPFFDPARYLRAFNEVELTLADGNCGRIDRLVECPDGWWVLDYKTGAPDSAPLDQYRRQLAGYREAVAQMFPGRPVRCVLIFGNARRIDL